jgi:Fe-S-cluster containining protein
MVATGYFLQIRDLLNAHFQNQCKYFRQLKMDEKENIFLTQHQAIDAIQIDFKQYGSQFDLFQELCPIITDNKSFVTKESSNSCVLITHGRKSKMRQMHVRELGDYLIQILRDKSNPLSVISHICSKVFQAKSWIAPNPVNETVGIWLETEMAHFKCRQCGNCCRHLKYHNDCSEKDYIRWEALGRKDILEKVIVIESDNENIRYKIWIKPDSNRLYPKCPWLIPPDLKNRYACRIQGVKPEYCRQYPLTRKHAMMTGCMGSFDEQYL